jgi:hypothetical protein
MKLIVWQFGEAVAEMDKRYSVSWSKLTNTTISA